MSSTPTRRSPATSHSWCDLERGRGVAQQAKVYRVGVLLQSSPPAEGQVRKYSELIFKKALADVGYIEGRNIVFDYRWAGGKNELFAILAAELAALKPDVILAESSPAVVGVMRATATIPLVMINVADPVGSGFVTSLARPGGNVTGLADLGLELSVKGLDVLHAVVPKATRIAVLMSDTRGHQSQLNAIEDAAKGIGLVVLPISVRSIEELDGAFASMTKRNAGAVILLPGSPFNPHVARLAALAIKAKLPAICWDRVWVDGGCLLSHGPDLTHKWSLAGSYVDKILKGAKPADLPVQQPTRIELVINLKSAKALRLTIPQSLLIRADDLIQ